MRRVAFDPATHAGISREKWEKWEARARRATRDLREHLEAMATNPSAEPELDPALWSALKDLLLDAVFNGRCAFCEVDESVGGFGDAEHYRPKGPVKMRDDEGKLRPLRVDGEPHRGYAWLAYDWQNLVPACSKCNTYKGSQFPVAQKHVTRPEPGRETTSELNAAEEPLLLHPYFDDPVEHLVVGEHGVIAAKDGSSRGHATIDVFRLNRDDLASARAREQRNAWREVKELMDRGLGIDEAIVAIEKRCEAGEERFSLAVVDHLWARLGEHIEEQKRKLAAAVELRARRRP